MTAQITGDLIAVLFFLGAVFVAGSMHGLWLAWSHWPRMLRAVNKWHQARVRAGVVPICEAEIDARGWN